MDGEIAAARELLGAASRVAVLSGAGISTDSGIPDFRGPNGTWTLNPADQRLATFSAYRDDPEVRLESWRRRLDHPAWSARPNAAHHALVDLERDGRLTALLTQNIATVSFGQALDPEVLERAWTAAATCEVMLVVGSSLTVHPAAGLVEVAADVGAHVVIANAEPTPYDRVARAVPRGRLAEVLPEIVRRG